jgi:hypothetical protein
MICVSDGISSVMTDDEVVDLARDAADPTSAAEQILAFAEEMGSEDNATVIVVPLAGWGRIRGPDSTKELRDYRRRQAGQHQRCDRSFFPTISRQILLHVQLVVSDKDGCELCYDSWTIIPGVFNISMDSPRYLL